MAPRILRHLAAVLAASTATLAVTTTSASATGCHDGGGATTLNAAFAARIDGLSGADYQRAIPLPDGRTLWTLQDAFIDRHGRPERLVHNVAVVEERGCFSLLRSGTAADPTPWIGAATTDHFHHWFWPLGGTVTPDGTIAVFVAEMIERGPRYLTHTEPVATWLATVDPSSLKVITLEPATDPGPQLYGWAVASDQAYTYLYGHCYRQFGFGFLGHDPCTSSVTVARVAGHDLRSPMQYWDGRRWTTDPATAANIAPEVGPDGTARAINPMQIVHTGKRWMAVTKEGDWWGSRLYFDRAPGPTGPWTTVSVETVVPLGPSDLYNTYFASLAVGAAGQLVIGISNNRFDGIHDGNYRPTFVDVDASRWSFPHPPPRSALR